MKDERGHGSNKRGVQTATRANAGNHQAGVLRIGGPIKVQQLNPKLAGQPWETVRGYRNRTVAERQAQYARVDNPNTLVRVR
jgi:hypothetical protein